MGSLRTLRSKHTDIPLLTSIPIQYLPLTGVGKIRLCPHPVEPFGTYAYHRLSGREYSPCSGPMCSICANISKVVPSNLNISWRYGSLYAYSWYGSVDEFYSTRDDKFLPCVKKPVIFVFNSRTHLIMEKEIGLGPENPENVEYTFQVEIKGISGVDAQLVSVGPAPTVFRYLKPPEQYYLDQIQQVRTFISSDEYLARVESSVKELLDKRGIL